MNVYEINSNGEPFIVLIQSSYPRRGAEHTIYVIDYVIGSEET